MSKQKQYLKRAEELLQSVKGNYEHSTEIQDEELVEWLIKESSYPVKMNAVTFICLCTWAIIGVVSWFI